MQSIRPFNLSIISSTPSRLLLILCSLVAGNTNMGVPETPSTPHLYPQEIQVKLYQAFIFSIPILFSIILFLLFYLFYLKRRVSNALSSAAPPILPTTLSQATSYISSTGLKGDVRDNFLTIVVDEGLREKDSPCCVCLGEFEIKEKLLQVPSCKHVFHVDCIYNWLQTNTTCPLCRCSVIPITKHQNTVPSQATGAVVEQNQ